MKVHRPFKGNTFYEWQIGRIVLQIRHRPNPHFGRIRIWIA